MKKIDELINEWLDNKIKELPEIKESYYKQVKDKLNE